MISKQQTGIQSESNLTSELEAKAHDAQAKAARLFARAARAHESAPKPGLSAQTPIYATIKDLCRELNISKATVNRLCHRGMPFTLVGSRKRFDSKAVREWLERGSIQDRLDEQAKRKVSTSELRTLGFNRRSI